MNVLKVKMYLERIGVISEPGSLPLSYDTLKELQYAHVTSVPYENLDILKGIPLSLEYGDIYDKIVNRHRGGYCFELNGLFGWLLEELGFDTKDYMGRFLRGESGIPMRRHRVKIVTIDGTRYICDTGVGSKAPKWPLIVQEGLMQEQFGESYKFEKEDFLGWVLYDFSGGEWKKIFSFTEEEQLNIDYIMPSFYCEKHPDSIFRTSNMISIKTADGRKTISDMIYRVFAGEDAVETVIENEEMLNRILKDEFGIKL